MANNLEDFFKKVPGSTNEIMDVDLVVTQSGDLKFVYGIDAILKSLSRIFLMAEETYLFDPNIGTGLYKFIFEPATLSTKSSIETIVDNTIAKYVYKGKVDYKILFYKNKKGFRIDLSVKYDGKTKKTSISMDETLLKTLD